jgi:hypothetical protein
MIAAVAQEGIEQIAMRPVQFDAVKARLDRPARGVSEISDNSGNLLEGEGARLGDVHEPLARNKGLGVGPDGRWPYWRRAVLLELCVRHSACMPQLDDDGPALGVNRSRDGAPARDLPVGVAAGRIGVALGLSRNLRRLCDD